MAISLKADSTRVPGLARPSAIVAWCFYDWANSAFPAVITTFVPDTAAVRRIYAPFRRFMVSIWGEALTTGRLRSSP